jgi:hypothetical protein
MLQIKALSLCSQISPLDNCNRVKSKYAHRNVGALNPEVRLRYVNLEVFWMFPLVIREYLRSGSLFEILAFHCFVALGWGGGGSCVSTRQFMRIGLAVAVSLPETNLYIPCVFCRADM